MKKILCVCGLFVLINSVSLAQSGYFLKIDGIEGEAKNKAHAKWINIESFSQSIEKEPSQGKSRAVFSTIKITKMIDASSVKIAEAVAQGKEIKSIEIHCVRNGATFYSYKLTNVVISAYSISGASGEMPFEEVAFSFEGIEATYSIISPKTGKAVGKIPYRFNTKTGQ